MCSVCIQALTFPIFVRFDGKADSQKDGQNSRVLQLKVKRGTDARSVVNYPDGSSN